MSNRYPYKTLIVGASGRGKTYSFKNMKRDSTYFINVENKPLPFKGSFKYNVVPNDSTSVLNLIKTGNSLAETDCIVVDSFSAFTDMLMAESRKTYKGWDIMNKYNEGIATFNKYVKNCKKEVFVTAHYEVIADEMSGSRERRVKTKGKEWEGMIEKDYTIVLYADSKIVEGSPRPEHFFSLVNDGSTSAKIPPDIFGEDIAQIPNDSAEVLRKIVEFSS